MKKLIGLFYGLFLLVFSITANAQSQPSADYFVGRWNVLVEGLPQGDTKMIVQLERKDKKLAGMIMDSTDTEISKFEKIEETEKSVTVYFSAQGYDVYLTLEKKDEDHVTGTMMGMFEAKGDRMKEKKTK